MHLPHLSPTGLAGRTSSGNSMDDDSSSSVMGYGNPYLASGISREIGNNLTQDPDAAYRYVGKLNAQQRDSNGWKMDKLCDGRSYDSPGLVNWLAGEEEEQDQRQGQRDVESASAEEEEDEELEEEEENHNSENKTNTDDEEKYSTEEDAKYSEGFDSSIDETARESGDEGEEGSEGQDTFLSEADAWIDPKSHNQELLPKRKLLWDGREESSLSQEEHWQGSSSSEAKPSQIENEREKKRRPKGLVSGDTSGPTLPRPVLCFDEYGNLTTYQDQGEIEMPGPFTSPTLPCAINNKWESLAQTSVVQEPKVLRSRTRASLESSESATMVSEQELQQAFKEEVNTAATSRYGRARKRKTADGFFFGTINFNELRKITSGSPKKSSKGSTPKNTSPDQKAKVKEPQLSLVADVGAKDLMDLNKNGIEALNSKPINGEAEVIVPPQDTVQMDQAKDSTLIVQSKNIRTREERAANRRRSTAAPAPAPTITVAEKEVTSCTTAATTPTPTTTIAAEKEITSCSTAATTPTTTVAEKEITSCSTVATTPTTTVAEREVTSCSTVATTPTTTITATTTAVTEKEVTSQDSGQEEVPCDSKSDSDEASKAIVSLELVRPRKRPWRVKSKARASEGSSKVMPQLPSRRSSRFTTALANQTPSLPATQASSLPVSQASSLPVPQASSLPVSQASLPVSQASSPVSQASSPVSQELIVDLPMTEEITVKEEPITEDLITDYIKEEPMESSQMNESSLSCESHSVDQGDSLQTRSDNQEDSNVKAVEEKLMSSITKSGRVIKKPQLMDISDEDKRQKQTREQQRQYEALLNSSLEEELVLSTANLQVLEKEHPCQYMVGDLVWVHIRGSPLWPSMISYDPVLGQYSRVATKLTHMLKYSGVRMYHVQFFSDNSLTQWIAPTGIVPFEGYDKLKEYLLDLKSKVKYSRRNRRGQHDGILKTLMHMNKVSTGQKHERWMTAISEANMARDMDRYERIQKHTIKAEPEEADTHAGARQLSRGSRGSQGRTTEGQPDRKKRGRPRKSSLGEAASKSVKTDEDSIECEFSGFEDVTLEGTKQKRSSLTSRMHRQKAESYAQEHLEDFLQENPGMSEEAALKKLRWRWRKLNGAQGGRLKGAGGKRKHQRGGDSSNEGEDEEGSNEGVSTKRQRLEEERGVYKVVRNEKVCCRCEGVSVRGGADMVRCKGHCCGVFHLGCLGLASMPRRDFKCEECLTERHPCFICKSSVGPVQRCSVTFCGKFYHDACLHRWPQVSRQRQQEKFVCPRHVCHMCAANADDICDSLARMPPFTRCLRCPTTYHTGEGCLAAGTEEVSQTSHICTKHLQLPKNISHHVNVNWCFCCSKGGSLLLCDQCPAAFHAECMNITAPEGGYVCEDCESGKFPAYGDVVWVKLGLYRWWPGQVLHPRFIPDNIENLPHQQGMFCVHFFGSNDYYWVTRGRAFLYQEGDKGSRAQSSRTLEIQFRRAVGEALEAYREQRNKRNLQELRWSEKGNLKPPPYIRIDTNRPVGNVRLSKVDLAAINRCDCEPNSDNPCGSDEKCLNRMLMFECMREVCGAGDRCGNQRFQKKKYPTLTCFKTEDRGWGLKTLQNISKGEFVIEYVGELIDDEEFRRRIMEMHDVKEENYYFLTIDKDIMIDAGPKGNLARFMNHSCHPNCETQKWTVGGDTRVGLFAKENIPEGSELTFNYNLQCVGTEKKRCCCGAPNCSGFIGVKVQKTEIGGPKREKNVKQRRKKRRREVKLSEDECFRCGGSGALILCDGVECPKGYHLECLGLDKLPRGKWICPWHHCDECGQWSTRMNRCDYCPNSYCRQHLMDNLQHIHGLGNVCQDHDTEELETLRGQMETTAVIENSKVQDQQKSDVDSDSGHGTLHPSPSPQMKTEGETSADTAMDRQQKSENYSNKNKPASKDRVPRKPRRRSSQSSRLGHKKRRMRKRKILNSVSRRNTVNGLIVQGKRGAMKQTEEKKAKHVNEA